MPNIVYILKSDVDGSYYTGFTSDLNKRLFEHNSGYSKYSSNKRPFKLAWHGEFDDKGKALDFERYLKSGSGIAFARKRLI